MTMKSILSGLLTALFAFGLHAAVYEKYLTPGIPLDDKILKVLGALKTDPKSSELHNTLGALLQEKRFPNDALQEFKKAVKLDKKNYRAWFNMGLARESEGQFFRAFSAFKKSLRCKSGFDLAHYHVGMIYERWGFRRAAIKHYALAVHYNPKILDASYNPAIAYNEILPEVLWYIYDKYRTSTMQPYQVVQVPVVAAAITPAASPAVKPAEPLKTAPAPRKAEVKPAQPKTPEPAPNPQAKPADQGQAPPPAKQPEGGLRLKPAPVAPPPSSPPEDESEDDTVDEPPSTPVQPPEQPPSSPVQPVPPDAQAPPVMPMPDQPGPAFPNQ